MTEESTPDRLSFPDPRRRGFRARSPVDEVVAWIDRRVGTLAPEEMLLEDAAGRVLAVEIRAAEPVPPFDRAAMDGFALRGEETFGADAYSPALHPQAGWTFRGLVLSRHRPPSRQEAGVVAGASRLRSGASRGRAGRADGDRRGIDPLQHHSRRWFRPGPGRSRRLPRRRDRDGLAV